MPTRCGARPDPSHAAASTAHRSAEGRCCHSSYAGVGAQTGSSDPSSATQPGDVGDLGHEGGVVGVHVQPGGEPAQVAHGQAAGAQDPRRAGAPVGRDLVDQAEQVRGLAARGVVDGVAGVRGEGERRRLEVEMAVQPVAAQPQGHLARHDDVVGRERADQLVRQEPGARRRGRDRPSRGRRPGVPTSGGPGWRAPPAGPGPPARRSPRRWRGWTEPCRAAPRTTARARRCAGRAPRSPRAPRAARRCRARAAPPPTGCRRRAPSPRSAAPAGRRPGRGPPGRRRRRGPPAAAGGRGPGRPARAARWPGCRPVPRAR